MFEEKGHEEQDSSTDEEGAVNGKGNPEVINLELDEPISQTQVPLRCQKRKQHEGAKADDKGNAQHPATQKQHATSKALVKETSKTNRKKEAEKHETRAENESTDNECHEVSSEPSVGTSHTVLPSAGKREPSVAEGSIRKAAKGSRNTEEQRNDHAPCQQGEPNQELTFMEAVKLNERQKNKRNERDDHQVVNKSKRKASKNKAGMQQQDGKETLSQNQSRKERSANKETEEKNTDQTHGTQTREDGVPKIKSANPKENTD